MADVIVQVCARVKAHPDNTSTYIVIWTYDIRKSTDCLLLCAFGAFQRSTGTPHPHLFNSL